MDISNNLIINMCVYIFKSIINKTEYSNDLTKEMQPDLN